MYRIVEWKCLHLINKRNLFYYSTISYQTENTSNKSFVSKFKGWFKRSSKDDINITNSQISSANIQNI